MKLILKNIGLLKDAELELSRLSLIAGENDNGKSTVGKVIFCLVKAINRYREDLEESKEYRIEEEFKNVFFFLRSLANESYEFKNDTLRTLQSSEYDFSVKIDVLNQIIDELKNTFTETDALNQFISQRDKILAMIDKPEDTRELMENALNKVFVAEFDSRILLDGEDEGFIGLYEQNIKLIEVQIFKNKIHLVNNVEPIVLEDATFIETPLILNNHDLLIRSKSAFNLRKRTLSYLGIPYTTFHTKDLFDKLIEPPFGDLFDTTINKLVEKKLREVVNGEIIYDNREKDFIFKKDQGGSVPIRNTASGIKVFGILQLLSSNDFINKKSLLIFDEPENHLHPKWQLKLAEILIDLAEQGVYILVSSHSPYMIEALKRYSDLASLEKESSFYLAKENSIQNKDKLEEIFQVLSEPFEVFREMDRELLKDE